MKITAKISITRSQENGAFLLNGAETKIPQDELCLLYKACRGCTDEQKISIFNRLVSEGRIPSFNENGGSYVSDKELALSTLSALIEFFSEFEFKPNFRFVNTLSKMAKAARCNSYINNYFRLIDSPYATEIASKIESAEFANIIGNFSKLNSNKTVNDRLKIYFGPQGTGKTTAALKETDDLSVVCNASMLPADLMEDFTFDDGKATFHPSVLARCMEEGKPIVLDEINLLPFDSLRFLQGITDDKDCINYKGNTIHIKDGFKIIGTMNLVVNGVTFGLPEPLVDRCEDINEFELNAEQLLNALL